MSLKLDKSNYSATSITGKLTLLYTLVSFLLIIVALSIIYLSVITMIHHQDEAFLTGELKTIEKIILDMKGTNMISALRQEIILEPETNPNHYMARVLKNNDAIVLQTPELTQLISTTDFPNVDTSSNATSMTPAKHFKAHNHQHYLLITLKTHKHHVAYTIQVALNITKSDRIIAFYEEILLLTLAITFFLCLISSYIMTRRGLRPIYALNKAIHEIDVDNLNTVLANTEWPTELIDTVTVLNRLLERIKSAFERLTQFSSDIAHELRNPLNTLICQTEIELSKPRDVTEYKTLLASNLEELNKLAELFEKMLFIARAKQPTAGLKIEALSFTAEMTVIIEYYQILAKEKNIDIHFVGKGTIHADLDLFKRAVGNILSNAIKYTSASGQITITLSTDKTYSILSIQDSGIGIDEHHLEHIFDRFYRVDSARAKTIEGFGLGLAIVESIMELHGGTVSIHSEPNVGTTVLLSFPDQSLKMTKL